MKIAQSLISLASQRQAVQKHTVKESLRVWTGPRPAESDAVEVNLSPQARRGAPPPGLNPPRSNPASASTTRSVSHNTELEEDCIGDPKLRMIKLLFEKIFGEKFDLFDYSAAQAEAEAKAQHANSAAAANSEWGAEYNYEEHYFEAEATTVSAAGIIQTTDGQEISFQLDLTMSREFMTDKHVNLRLGNAAVDPIVINFEGTAAQLSDTKFMFDLNADGQSEEISRLTSNSGFLALDRNNDGQVNDGSELFGPATGNGFAELAAYDGDGNQWLDENDAVFSDLRIWMMDDQGQSSLASLADKGIGALYLAPVSSEFAVKDSQNEAHGQIRSSSLYVNENGSVGSMQQLDLVV